MNQALPRARTTSPRRALALVCAAALAATSGGAEAQPTPEQKALAETLFQDALRDRAEGEHARACPKLARAVELTQGEALGGMLELGKCYEAIGKTASAWATYRQVAARAAQTGQDARKSEAISRGEALEGRLHRVTLELAPALSDLPGLRITRGETELPREAWAVPAPVDPGELIVVASAPGHRDASYRLTVPPTPGVTKVALAPLAQVPAASPSPGPNARPAKPRAESFAGPAALGALAGVGLASVGVAVGLGVDAKARYDRAHSQGWCGGAHTCTAAGKQETDAARAQGDVATGLFVAGAVVALGAGAAALAWGLRKPTQAARLPSPMALVDPRGSAAFGLHWSLP